MPTQSFSGGATSLKMSRFHMAIFSFISFYPRLSVFIPGKPALDIPGSWLLDVLHIQFYIPGRRRTGHSQPPDLDLCPPEVDQEAGFQPGAPHVIEALGHIRVSKHMGGLHLYEDASIYEEIGFIIPDINAIVENLDALLLNHVDLGFP